MAFDYKKEFKELYLPPKKPVIVDVPEMKFVSVRGHGDPNDVDSGYKASIEMLYSVSYTIKMSKMGDRRIAGYFDYVVPPLEGLWWSADNDLASKKDLEWISMIRLPDFVDRDVFDWAVDEASRKRKIELSKAEMIVLNEGRCVQCMHIGSYDDEARTIGLMEKYCQDNGLMNGISSERHHHEIYLSDPRRVSEENLKTVIRIPVER